jgi:hypothetical protein
MDVDFVVAMGTSEVEPFLDALGEEFYAEPKSLHRAIREKSSANLIHQPTSTKVDLFILGGTPIDAQQMRRRERVLVTTEPDRQSQDEENRGDPTAGHAGHGDPPGGLRPHSW